MSNFVNLVQSAASTSSTAPVLSLPTESTTSFGDELDTQEQLYNVVVRVSFVFNGIALGQLKTAIDRTLDFRRETVNRGESWFTLFCVRSVSNQSAELLSRNLSSEHVGVESCEVTPILKRDGIKSTVDWFISEPPFEEMRQSLMQKASALIPTETLKYAVISPEKVLGSMFAYAVQKITALFDSDAVNSFSLTNKDRIWAQMQPIKIKGPPREITTATAVSEDVEGPVLNGEDRPHTVDIMLRLRGLSQVQCECFQGIFSTCRNIPQLTTMGEKDLHISLCVLDNVRGSDINLDFRESVRATIGERTVIIRPVQPVLETMGILRNFAVLRVDGGEDLYQIASDVRKLAMERFGIQDLFPFNPHVTIAMNKEGHEVPNDISIPLDPQKLEFRVGKGDVFVGCRPMTKTRIQKLKALQEKKNSSTAALTVPAPVFS